MLHLEPFVDAVLIALKADLPGMITALNTATTDFDLDQIQDSEWYVGGTDAPLAYPAIEVAAPELFLRNPSIDQQHWDGRVRVIVRVWAEGFEYEELYRRVMRYGRCIAEVLTQREIWREAGLSADLTDLAAMYRFNPETNERQMHVGGALIVATVETEDVRP
jgi:hypothetical protein